MQGLAKSTLFPDSLSMDLLAHQMVLKKGPARTSFFCALCVCVCVCVRTLSCSVMSDSLRPHGL